MSDDLVAWLHQQLENQRFRGESLKTLAFGLPPETGAYLTETGDLLLADVDAKRRMLDELIDLDGDPVNGMTITRMFHLLAEPYADRPGYREDWKP